MVSNNIRLHMFVNLLIERALEILVYIEVRLRSKSSTVPFCTVK